MSYTPFDELCEVAEEEGDPATTFRPFGDMPEGLLVDYMPHTPAPRPEAAEVAAPPREMDVEPLLAAIPPPPPAARENETLARSNQQHSPPASVFAPQPPHVPKVVSFHDSPLLLPETETDGLAISLTAAERPPTDPTIKFLSGKRDVVYSHTVVRKHFMEVEINAFVAKYEIFADRIDELRENLEKVSIKIEVRVIGAIQTCIRTALYSKFMPDEKHVPEVNPYDKTTIEELKKTGTKLGSYLGMKKKTRHRRVTLEHSDQVKEKGQHVSTSPQHNLSTSETIKLRQKAQAYISAASEYEAALRSRSLSSKTYKNAEERSRVVTAIASELRHVVSSSATTSQFLVHHLSSSSVTS